MRAGTHGTHPDEKHSYGRQEVTGKEGAHCVAADVPDRDLPGLEGGREAVAPGLPRAAHAARLVPFRVVALKVVARAKACSATHSLTFRRRDNLWASAD